MAEHKLTLPVPPSANKYWRVYKNRIVTTDEARVYKQEIQLLFRELLPIAGNVAVNFTVYRPAKRGDLDNYNKIMLDALQGLVYSNDNQITEIHSFRRDDHNNPRVELLVYEAEGFE